MPRFCARFFVAAFFALAVRLHAEDLTPTDPYWSLIHDQAVLDDLKLVMGPSFAQLNRAPADPARLAASLAALENASADRPDAVPDEVWADAAKHFDYRQLAAIVLWIATTNFFNRLNVTTRQPAGQAW